MRVYVVCDIEGTAGVVDFAKQCSHDGKYYEQARRLATLELNALVEGALEGGATEIVAWDGHCAFPGGLDIELLHPECKLLIGAGDGGPLGLDKGFDALMQVGLHARAGVKDGIISHSFDGRVASFEINGIEMGEIGLNMLTAGEAKTPCILVCGDRAAIEEAQTLVPGIIGAAVKDGVNRKCGFSLSPLKARQVIKKAARHAMSYIGKIQPYTFSTPYVVRVKFTEAHYAEDIASRPNINRIDELTVEQLCKSTNEINVL